MTLKTDLETQKLHYKHFLSLHLFKEKYSDMLNMKALVGI